MTPDQLSRIEAWFSDYVAGFYTGDAETDANIGLKEIHTRRVRENMAAIAEALEQSPADRRLADAMALLHDIGRFEQYRVYRTFLDLASENHALLGIRVLARHRPLKVLAPDDRRRILRSIAFHNAAAPPADEDEQGLTFMRMLRDADKLDIWRVVTDYYRNGASSSASAVGLGLPDTPDCSETVVETLAAGRFVRISDVRTLNDFKLLQISWVYDINYPRSFAMLAERGYLRAIADTLPPAPTVEKAVEQAIDYARAAAARPPAIVTR